MFLDDPEKIKPTPEKNPFSKKLHQRINLIYKLNRKKSIEWSTISKSHIPA